MKTSLWNIWVTLHWLMAILLITLFLIGQLRLTTLNPDETKAIPLTFHIFLGSALMLIAGLRLALRRKILPKPLFSRASDSLKKNPIDLINQVTQPMIYFATLLMGISGISMSIPAGYFNSLFLDRREISPIDMSVYPARQFHVFISILLTIFVILHLLVFIQHQLIFKEKYFKKIWFIKRKPK